MPSFLHHISLSTGLCVLAITGSAQRAPQPPPLTLASDAIELTIAGTGGTFSRLTLRDNDPLSPLSSHGHFLALDGFGDPSAEERAGGMPFHGEASRVIPTVVARHDAGPVRSLTLRSELPLARETLTRTIEIVDGEQVVSVTSALQSDLAIDRPITWAEHATIGGAFLEADKTVVDMPATTCRVRPEKPTPLPSRLLHGQDFQWPMAPTATGDVDLRTMPGGSTGFDLAACLMDPAREHAYVTALNIERGLLFGYLFRRADYPWLMNWLNYTGDGRAARGMEFSTQPFDVSRREAVDMGSLFGVPTFRWLPAHATIQTRFLMFYTHVPEGFSRVHDVAIANGELTIDDGAGRRVVLRASKGL